MKNVNLFGMTTAEKLIKLEKAYDELMASVIYNGHYEGEWNATTEYGFGAYVNYKGSSYIYINEVASINTNPENGVPWVLIAEKGDTGGIEDLNMYNPFIGQSSNNFLTNENNVLTIKFPIAYDGRTYKYFRFHCILRISYKANEYTGIIQIPETPIKENVSIANTSYISTFVSRIEGGGYVPLRILYNIKKDATHYIYTVQIFDAYTIPIEYSSMSNISFGGTIGFSED